MIDNNYGLGGISRVIDPALLQETQMQQHGQQRIAGNVSGGNYFSPEQQAATGNYGGSNLFMPQQQQQQSGVGNLETELATIQALRASNPSGGLGQSIGGALGGVGGAVLGGPGGAAIGAGAGQAVGSVVDYMINNKANKRAEAKELKARRAAIKKEKALANATTIKADRQRLMGISQSIEQGMTSDKELSAQNRQVMLDRMMEGLQGKTQYNDFIKNKILANRSV